MAEDKDIHGIMEIKTFVDEKGREVTQFTPFYRTGTDPEPLPKYRGTARLVIKRLHPVTKQEMIQERDLTFVYPEGTNLKQAFKIFDELADAEVKRWQSEQQRLAAEEAAKNKIQTARAMPTIVGPNGRKV